MAQIILDTINTLFSQFFSSIDQQMYVILDKLAFISPDILTNSSISSMNTSSILEALLTLANCLLIGFSIYYAVRLLYSQFSYVELERPYQFVFKLLIFAIALQFSYFICEQILQISYYISGSILEIGSSLLHKSISFENLIQNLNELIQIEETEFSIFSIDGILKGFISFQLLNLMFSYALRYIMVKVFVLLTPFALLCLMNHSTSWFFKIWVRNLLSLLLLQSLISFILILVFSIDYTSQDLLSKFMYIGGIYALSRAGNYTRELLGGISTDISTSFSNVRSLLK